ncbi:hypothetical protein G6F46_004647 [Rhizopus delemar]|uniref:Nucleoside diphosphate kinase n=2 Tax=Rhizopus TaxID=4842 RepID=A0A9P6Z0P2_9FUNG|nr:hypothetical protein G6F55_006374 [Rhizopus delemar]KAG1541662.1 hypothetical protein G6F51_007752 [Rhizopus arrhizus]KAG1495865.1 hypothetical protein G6F54_006878 [Rhizopus delemar]KAG1509634.1 hypothetical protein G6F53_007294 [Rhizopus delemar]KAG1527212.1 hypothetical protein G6F52_001742 [Rhizopus delemar]
MERQEQQKTFGIVPLKSKDEIKQKIKQKGFKLMLGTSIESSNELTENFNILKKQLPIFAFVLQGKDAIRIWLKMIKQEKEVQNTLLSYHASNTSTEAEREISLFQTFVKSSVTVKKVNVQKKSVSRVPLKKRNEDAKTSDTNQELTMTKPLKTRVGNSTVRKASDGVTNRVPTNQKRAKGGVSKNTPPVSVVTGRTRKVGKMSEKAAKEQETKATKEEESIVDESKKKNRPVMQQEESTVENQEKKQVIVEETAAEASVSIDKPVIKEEVIIEKKDSFIREVEESIVKDKLAIKKAPIITNKESNETVLQYEPVSHFSTCSSAVSDEHDAEVAAATRFMTTRNQEDHLERYSPSSNRRSSTLSPNSAIASRPETPEISELRSKFENIIHTGNQPSRPVSKMSNEFISRIKEMKPRDPTGSRVKSMVEFFMDENLNKWEF